MALPKRRQSKSRGRKRRTHYKSGLVATTTCPQCGSKNTEMKSMFGSTACKALYVCKKCLEPFDYFKCI